MSDILNILNTRPLEPINSSLVKESMDFEKKLEINDNYIEDNNITESLDDRLSKAHAKITDEELKSMSTEELKKLKKDKLALYYGVNGGGTAAYFGISKPWNRIPILSQVRSVQDFKDEKPIRAAALKTGAAITAGQGSKIYMNRIAKDVRKIKKELERREEALAQESVLTEKSEMSQETIITSTQNVNGKIKSSKKVISSKTNSDDSRSDSIDSTLSDFKKIYGQIKDDSIPNKGYSIKDYCSLPMKVSKSKETHTNIDSTSQKSVKNLSITRYTLLRFEDLDDLDEDQKRFFMSKMRWLTRKYKSYIEQNKLKINVKLNIYKNIGEIIAETERFSDIRESDEYDYFKLL